MGGIKLKNICSDCKGSGKYIGLMTVDTCKTCSGIGYIEDIINLEQYMSLSDVCPTKENYNSCFEDEQEITDEQNDNLVYNIWLDTIDSQTYY